MWKKWKKIVVLTVALVMFASFSLSVSAATLKDYFNAKYYASLYPDLQEAFGNDEEALYEHYITYGIKEGRSASRIFNVNKYREKYEDLEAVFGDDWDAYANHYAVYGIKEGRDGGGDGTKGLEVYEETYYDIYAAYGPTFFMELEKGDMLGTTTDREALITPYYSGKNALKASSQSKEMRKNIEEHFDWAEGELVYTSWYYIAYLNATDEETKNNFGRLYNGSYKEFAKLRDYIMLNGTKEDAEEWYYRYHAVSGAQGVSKGWALPESVAVSD